MTGFSATERWIARALSASPRLKRWAKAAYARAAYLASPRGEDAWTEGEISVVGPQELESFFGYYDKTPDGASGFILAHLSARDTRRPPSADAPIEVALFAQDDLAHPVARFPSRAYNWQQGSRLHWLDDAHFIYNDFVDGRYRAFVRPVADPGDARSYDRPVQDSWGGRYFLSLNYRRLFTLRPDYGYRNLPALNAAELRTLDDDGIWRVETDSGAARLLVTLAQVCAVEPRAEFADATHKVNHVMISPDGTRFIFLHRYFRGGRRFDRLLVADATTGEVRALTGPGMVSHCCWIDDSSVLSYLATDGAEPAYRVLDVERGHATTLTDPLLSRFGDGHPHANGGRFVTDTYPDRARLQHLILCEGSGQCREIARLRHPFAFDGESRCDLHPRLSTDASAVFVDSVFSGRRRLYRIAVRG